MNARVHSTFDSGSPWHAGWLAPLNLAAYITWLAISLQAPEWPLLRAGDPRQIGGTLALLVMLLAYLVTNATRTDQRPGLQRALVLLQALALLLASYWLRHGGPAVLMIIVAGQAIAIWPVRQAIAGLAVANLVLLTIWLQAVSVTSALLSLASMIAFQTFAALTVHYATSAERARAELAQTHAQLLATQRLLEDSARSGERLRLSRELHDVAGHKLTALKLNLRLLQRDPLLAEREEVGIAATLADELLQDIRAVVSELRKHDGIDLAAAITTLTEQIPGTHFRVAIDPALKVTDIDRAEILLRCAQEGITNALRHGRAHSIDIACREVAGRIELKVVNDGPPLHAAPFGNGLTGMRERLAAAGGELSLQPRTQGGAELLAAIPAHG